MMRVHAVFVPVRDQMRPIPLRAAKLARAQLIGIRDRRGRQVARIGCEKSQIEFWIARRNLGLHNAAVGKPNAPDGPLRNVCVRHNESIRAPDHTRTAAAPCAFHLYRGAPHSFGHLR